MSDHQLSMAAIRALQAEVAGLSRDLAAARRDLAEYGSHRLGCTKIGRNPFSTDCTCGLPTALADAPEMRTAGLQEVLEAEDERSGMDGTA